MNIVRTCSLIHEVVNSTISAANATLLSQSSEVVTELHGVPIKISDLSTFVGFDDNQSEAIMSRFSNENKI